MTRRALVTGATGFVGSHLVARLVDRGWSVSALVLPTPDVARLDSRVRALELDGSTSRVIECVAESSPDVVFHLASLFIAEHVSEQVSPLVEANVLFGAQLLEGMHVNGCDALVNTGTSWQHLGDADYDPVCLYAATKQAFEDIAAFFVNAHGLRMQTLRLFDTYGPDDPRPKLFGLLRTAASEGRVLEMSPGEQQIALVHIDDVVGAFEIAAERTLSSAPGTSEAWAVSGERMSLREVVARWEAASGRSVDVRWGGRQYRVREVMDPWHGRVLEGWSPAVGFDEGVAAMESSLWAGDR